MSENLMIVFYILIAEASLVGVVLSLISFSYYKLTKKLAKVEEENKEFKKQAELKEEKVLDKAQEEASDIIKDAQFFTDALKEKFNNDIQSKYQEVIKNISKDITDTVISETAKFRQEIEKEINLEIKNTQAEFLSQKKLTDEEIENYKKAALVKTEAQIAKIIEDTSRLVIGKSLSLEQQEELVLNALEEAKRENVL